MFRLKTVQDVVRRHERGIAGAYVILLVGAIAAIMVPTTRRAVGTNLERVAIFWDGRWVRRVYQAESLLDAGRVEEAATLLQDLDTKFPARDRVHALAWARIRLLRRLGEADLTLGRKRKSLDAFRALVDFDPRDYSNHFQLGVAAEAFGEAAEALAAYSVAFAINPAHLPTLEALIRMSYEAGAYDAVVNTYQQFLTARIPVQVSVQLGRDSTAFLLDADDAVLPVRMPLPAVVVVDSIFIRFEGAAIEVDALELHRALTVGAEGMPTPLQVPGSAATPGPRTTRQGDVLLPPRDAPGTVTLPVPGDAGPVSGVSLRVWSRRVIPDHVWTMVERSYRNTLQWAALASARRQTVTRGADPS